LDWSKTSSAHLPTNPRPKHSKGFSSRTPFDLIKFHNDLSNVLHSFQTAFSEILETSGIIFNSAASWCCHVIDASQLAKDVATDLLKALSFAVLISPIGRHSEASQHLPN
jgi:hypothetical protein